LALSRAQPKANEPKIGRHRRLNGTAIAFNGGGMTIHQAFAIGVVVIVLGSAEPAMAQACARDGPVVMCNDGRRGLLSVDAIVWPDGTRSNLTPHPSVIIGNKASVVIGQGVFVGQGKGMVPLDNPSAPNKMRCATLDGASYCN
jgi:hypothetical protein